MNEMNECKVNDEKERSARKKERRTASARAHKSQSEHIDWDVCVCAQQQ